LPGTPGARDIHFTRADCLGIGSVGLVPAIRIRTAPVRATCALVSEFRGVAFAAIIPWGAAQTLGSQPAALPQPLWQALFARWLCTGYGAAVGLPAWPEFSRSARDSLTRREPPQYSVWGLLSALALIWLLGRAPAISQNWYLNRDARAHAVYVLSAVAQPGWLAA